MDLLVAKETVLLDHDGQRFYLTAGRTIVHADDPIVKGREDLFRPLDVPYLGRSVEEATAAPGEKRSVSTRRKRGEA